MKGALKSRNFKKGLLAFLAEEWARDEYKDLLHECVLYVSFNKICIKLTGNENGVQREVVPELRNTHDEADTLIALHANHVNTMQPNANVVIRANDTDVLVIMIYHANHFTVKIWMDVGYNKDNTRRYIHVSKLLEAMEGMSLALPALHAFSGSDYTASFFRKGKVKVYKQVEASVKLQELFCTYGEDSDIGHLVSDTEKLVCSMYGKANMHKLQDVRYALFKQKYAPSTSAMNDDLLAKIKGADSTWLPPSDAVLLQKIKRTNYVSSCWKHAHMQDPFSAFGTGPLDNGWMLKDGKYRILWFEGKQLPAGMAYNIRALSSATEDEDDDNLIPVDLSDSDESDSERED
jgi:hypothetical protein